MDYITILFIHIAYVSPSSDNSKAKTVIFITDIFGYELVNTRLVADEYAAQGFHVVVPDLLEGKLGTPQPASSSRRELISSFAVSIR